MITVSENIAFAQKLIPFGRILHCVQDDKIGAMSGGRFLGTSMAAIALAPLVRGELSAVRLTEGLFPPV